MQFSYYTKYIKMFNVRFSSTANCRTIKIALIQMQVIKEKPDNLKHAAEMITTAASKGAKLIALPECFNCPYGIQFFKKYSEKIPGGETSEMLKNISKDLKIYLIGGSIPEVYKGKIYNTCTVWSPDGDLIAKYRKMHLFWIDIPNGLVFKESETLSAGNELSMFCLDDVKVGLGICYDIRFPELAKIYRMQGCELLIYPGAFNTTTGPIHWEILQRIRATDNQVFVVTISPARARKGYRSWGHSQVTNPWGKVIEQAGADECLIYTDLDFTECEKVRGQIPIFSQQRLDLYETQWKVENNLNI